MYSFPRRMWHRHNQSCGVGHRARAPRGALGLVTPGHITLTASRHLVTRASPHCTPLVIITYPSQSRGS